MIISHRHRFIFIKTKKTAGSSIEIFLRQFCGPEDIFTKVSLGDVEEAKRPTGGFPPQNAGGFANHLKAVDLRKKVPAEVWENYYKFCVERNPWDKMLSYYHHLNNGQHEGKLSLDEFIELKRWPIGFKYYMDRQRRRKANDDAMPGFLARLGEALKPKPKSKPKPEYDVGFEDNGNCLVDRVVYYENLADELGEVLSQFDIPFDGDLGVRAKGHHRKDRRPYQEVLTDKQAEVIGRIFHREIELHGYKY